IYNMNQGCISSGSNLPGTLMFSEGGSSSDTAAMGAYNGTGTTYDYYLAVHNRNSYDNLGAQLTSSVHGSFSNGTSCSKNNAAWLSSPFNQMAYGDGTLPTFSNLANGLDVTAHELTHAVTDKTAGLVYAKESGALNEGSSDILGRTTAFWAGNGNAATKTDWAIGADVYTPSTAGDALRYMYDPRKDGSSADYYPTRAYASGCTPSQANDECGVHGNSGIANLFYYLLSQGGTHPRGTTTVSVTGIGITSARQIWYRALTSYMTSGETFANARTHTAQAAADLYGGTCTATWQSVQKAWDAVGVGGTWSCGVTTYSIGGNAGTSGASVTAGSSSATSDASSNYSIGGLAAGTYTVTPSKSGCTFSPASQSVTVGPNATGKNFTATCGTGGSQLLSNPGFESGATIWTATAGVIDSSTGQAAHGGSWKAWMNGYGTAHTDTLYQQVTIASTVTSATLSFWLHIDTAETTTTTAYDKLTVTVRNSANTVLGTLATYSNLDKNTGYTQKSFNLSAYKGQTIRVYFSGVEDASLKTSFVVDDTALNVQ
ncbi:MAG: M4 family metallopeptidase, partial [Thermoanaerobaculia bacterium]